MTTLIIGALATFTVVIFVLACLPFRVPAKFNPLFITAVGYGTLELYKVVPTLVEAAAIATLVAAGSRFVVQELPKPWSWDEFLGRVIEFQIGVTKRLRSRQARVRQQIQRSPLGNRIPKL